MKFYVSRQSYYHSGKNAVEVAVGGINYSGPDMLVASKEYMRLGCDKEYTDPVEAVEVAIAVLKKWRETGVKPRPILVFGANLDMIEGSDSGISMREAMRRAKKLREQLPKCDECGELMPEHDYYTVPEFWGDDMKFCSENCADLAYEAEMRYLSESGDE